MVTSKTLIGSILLSIALLTVACDRLDVEQPDSSGARVAFTKMDEDQARAAFAKTLAKALEKKELRDFLKAKALEQFDEDYDVLFHAQKDQPVVGNQTFFDLLVSYHGSRQGLIDVTESLPKLNILVPELLNEKYYNSAMTWETEHFIPKVAAFGVNEKKAEVTAYDSKGKERKVKSKGDPDELILVIKDNERIEVSSLSPASLRMSADKSGEKSNWDYFMTSNGRKYYFSSLNYNRSKRELRDQVNKGARIRTIGTDFNVGTDSPEARSHSYRPEAPRGYAYYKTYYSNGQLATNTSEPFAGTLDYTVKDRIAYMRFMNMEKIRDLSSDWSEGNLELIGRTLIGGRLPESFQSRGFGGISFDRMAAQFTVPGFAEAVEAGYGDICIPRTFGGCRIENPIRDRFNQLRSSDVIFDNRGSATNSGVWLNWRGAELFTWDAEEHGNKIILIVLEKDGNQVYTEERTWSVGTTATIGKKDGSNLTFSGNSGGKSTVSWTDGDDKIFEQEINYNAQYGAFKPPVSTGDSEFILRVY